MVAQACGNRSGECLVADDGAVAVVMAPRTKDKTIMVIATAITGAPCFNSCLVMAIPFKLTVVS